MIRDMNFRAASFRYAALLFSMMLASCASHPQLYPNEKYKSVGKDAAKGDIEKCEKEADQYVESSTGKNAARGAGSGAVVGAAIGGVLGIFGGGVGRGLVTGGAVGAAGGGASGALKPDQIKHQYVNQCLHDQGYQVLGWD